MRDFLRTGEFGPIRLGDSVESLTSAFGDPQQLGGTSRKRRTPCIWKYGDIEFHLSDDRQSVWLIFCDTFDCLHLGSAASLDPWFFDGHPPRDTVEGELTAAQIPFHRTDMPHEPAVCLLRLNSGVELMFSTEDHSMTPSEVPKLFGFQYAHRHNG